ncbi:O-antigen ligase family protein [Methylorubrum sp. SL192]|uniref:O-antigen ligase family protein n=1 Tax=Methylorubrum sp. SL192 TaxID=2995167 RepID=UPI002273A5DA|nr:O-antigen ligase family protein [Methylorubrum sp. SL192]MCY1641540.1 O-antigen ligase family protein [Methylorubrum sp. SL192]
MSSMTAAPTGATAAASPWAAGSSPWAAGASPWAAGASPWAAGAWGRVPALRAVQGLASGLHAAFIFFACFAFSDASPYDLVAIPTIVLWLALGIRLHRGALPLVLLLLAYLTAMGIALLPYLNEPLSVTWTVQLFYLAATCIFFAMLYADDTQARIEVALKAYTASCVLSAGLGIVGYLQLLGIEDLFYKYGRASGTFQDPNVFGSFLTLGALYLIHRLLSGATRWPILSLLSLVVVMAGIFLSFSRGSWGGTVVAVAVMVVALYTTSRSRALRRRIVTLGLVTIGFGAVALAGLLSIDSVAQTFQTRAAVTQDYDEGETGRFGNQIRGMGMLLEEPLGLGPLRWRQIFNLEPHNSYIGSFANGGWLAGAAFIALVAATSFVGFRLMLRPSPYRAYAQIVFPALLMFFLQAMQIDVEKWRHVYMMLGMVWALEVARLRAAPAPLTHPLPRRIGGHPSVAAPSGAGGAREKRIGGRGEVSGTKVRP